MKYYISSAKKTAADKLDKKSVKSVIENYIKEYTEINIKNITMETSINDNDIHFRATLDIPDTDVYIANKNNLTIPDIRTKNNISEDDISKLYDIKKLPGYPKLGFSLPKRSVSRFNNNPNFKYFYPDDNHAAIFDTYNNAHIVDSNFINKVNLEFNEWREYVLEVFSAISKGHRESNEKFLYSFTDPEYAFQTDLVFDYELADYSIIISGKSLKDTLRVESLPSYRFNISNLHLQNISGISLPETIEAFASFYLVMRLEHYYESKDNDKLITNIKDRLSYYIFKQLYNTEIENKITAILNNKNDSLSMYFKDIKSDISKIISDLELEFNDYDLDLEAEYSNSAYSPKKIMNVNLLEYYNGNQYDSNLSYTFGLDDQGNCIMISRGNSSIYDKNRLKKNLERTIDRHINKMGSSPEIVTI